MKRNILRISLIMVLLVTLCATATVSVYGKSPKAHVLLSFEEEGILKGAEYRISVPREWNGTLLVYARGYSAEIPPPPVQIAPGWLDPVTLIDTRAEFTLLADGYALAGSSFSSGGFAIREGVKNTKDLVKYFKKRVGNPEHVIVWGCSMGTVVALKSIEKYPGIYDGAIAESGLNAGLPMQVDWFLGFFLAYAVAFDGWPEEWGPLGDVRDDINFEADVLPIIFPQYTDSANFGKWEFIRLVVDYPEELFWAMSPWGAPWPFINFMFGTEAWAELEQRAKGTVMQNLDHVYNLTEAEIADLSLLGVDASSLLADMNERTDIEARKPARKYLEHYGGYSGDITGPVITLHNRADPLCHVAHTGVYRDIVGEAGKADLLLQVFTDAVGHGNFTANQFVLTVEAMKQWLDTGIKPDPPDSASFPASEGFIPGFVIPPWPF